MEEKLIAGRYEIQKKIGMGGVARVYLARDQILGREVAVKILNTESAADPAFVERFRREAQAAASLNHPNIVSVFDWGKDTDTYFMVMEYVPGKNLKEVLEGGPIKERDALHIAAQIAGALDAAHQRGVIHRDVKPHNVMLMPNGRAKVADFGIARATGLSQLTQTNMVCGTAHYLSPEQLQRQPVDSRSDVYGLGVVLYEMVTGTEPFRGDSLVEVALQHLHDQPLPPRQIDPNISLPTQEIILRALQKDPKRRYATAATAKHAVERALSQLPDPDQETKHQPVPPRDRGTEPATRIVPLLAPEARQPMLSPGASGFSGSGRRRYAWLMAVPLLLALLGAASVFVFGREHGSKSPPHGSKVAAAHVRSVQRKSTPNVVKKATASHRAASPFSTQTTKAHSAQLPTSSPTVEATPTSLASPTNSPATVPAVALNEPNSQPVAAVQKFYDLINRGELAQAAEMWTSSMRAAYNPQQNIYARFQYTQNIRVEPGTPTISGSRATVPVTVVDQEAQGRPSGTYQGTWYLVKTNQGWLLDSTSFH